MSYCVNCGVKLGESERFCPLCNTEVLNPRAPFDPAAERPYPQHVEQLNRRVDRRYIATLLSLALTIPMIVCIFCNVLISGALTWSPVVAGGELVVFCIALLPMLVPNAKPIPCICLDLVAVLLFLRFLERITAGEWWLGLGLPLTLVAGALALLVALLVRYRRSLGPFVQTAIVLFAAAVLTLAAELFIKLYIGRGPYVNWSFYVAVSCVVLGFCTLILNRRADVKEEIRKRFFF